MELHNAHQDSQKQHQLLVMPLGFGPVLERQAQKSFSARTAKR